MEQTMKKILFIIINMICCTVAIAQNDSLTTDTQSEGKNGSKALTTSMNEGNLSKGKADSAYMNNDYVSAIQYYEDLLKERGEAADVYYNLGNSYYKADNIAKAILNYERALLLRPGDNDIRFNLEMARSKTVDKINPVSEMFFVSWIKSFMNIMGADGWAKWAIISFILLILSLILFIFSKRVVFKKIGFSTAILFFILVIVTNIFAFRQKKALTDRIDAIVISPSITVKSTPTEGGTDLFILHEGHKVSIKDNSMKGWKEIILEDGNVGWIPSTAIEII